MVVIRILGHNKNYNVIGNIIPEKRSFINPYMPVYRPRALAELPGLSWSPSRPVWNSNQFIILLKKQVK
jgi:hypothetical protein